MYKSDTVIILASPLQNTNKPEQVSYACNWNIQNISKIF